jgi:hypothetical protein
MFLTTLIALLFIACKAAGEEHTCFPPGSEEIRRVALQLAEVRIQWEGTPGRFYDHDYEDGFPGLHAPLTALRAADLVTSFQYEVDPNNVFTSASKQILERFNAYAAASGAPYILGEPIPTQTGPKWRRGAEALAFPLMNSTTASKKYERAYTTSDDGFDGKARYWILIKVIGITVR